MFMLSLLLLGSSACRRNKDVADPTEVRQSTAELIQKADTLYEQREDLSKVRAGITTLKEARVGDFSNYDILWRTAKFNYYLGSHSKNDDEISRAFRDGIDAGKAAVKIHNDRPEGHFWLGANYGGSAQTGVLAGLSSMNDIRNEMEAVLKIDPGYEGASAYMALGQVDLESPKVLGGDPERAVENLEKGVRLDPANSMMKLRLAEAYLKTNRVKDATNELDEIEKTTPDPKYLPEHKEVLTEAAQLRTKIEQRPR
jgi:tetratricopeptide (TPR) repeat protein